MKGPNKTIQPLITHDHTEWDIDALTIQATTPGSPLRVKLFLFQLLVRQGACFSICGSHLC